MKESKGMHGRVWKWNKRHWYSYIIISKKSGELERKWKEAEYLVTGLRQQKKKEKQPLHFCPQRQRQSLIRLLELSLTTRSELGPVRTGRYCLSLLLLSVRHPLTRSQQLVERCNGSGFASSTSGEKSSSRTPCLLSLRFSNNLEDVTSLWDRLSLKYWIPLKWFALCQRPRCFKTDPKKNTGVHVPDCHKLEWAPERIYWEQCSQLGIADLCKNEASLGYMVSTRPAWAM